MTHFYKVIIGFEDKRKFLSEVKADNAYCEKNECCVDGRQSFKVILTHTI